MPKRIKKFLGRVGVDAGLIWVGDPCYVFHKTAEELANKGLGKTWNEFCDLLDPKSRYTRFGDTGIVCESGAGDGSYPVYATFDETGMVVSLEIKFEEEEHDSEEV